MSILQGQTTSFKVELYNGYHAFSSAFRAVDVFKLALYTSSATLGPTTTVYSATNEITGTGYTAGGLILSPTAPLSSGTTACLSFSNAVWSPAVFTTAGGLIYNSTQGNRAVAVLSFGNNKTATTSFTIQFPVDDQSNAVIRSI